ncbi:hypothetical protein [Reyranella sp. CPCC 100927]|uniref:hypothetical protein n=1 Tax=Reyranella sp. CPCC 100927 TaxID=2599616 RepID=UPI0011B6F4A2|nr:hypothetical protein [Reyranella sp. CPCC 100927]TWS94701.1 hypothetical protein FQU96_40980 [Reyranella sp. CPCC 100927]
MFEQHFKLKISPQGLAPSAARRYEAAVRSDLYRIHGSASGKILLRAISYWSITIPIIPESEDQVCNAEVEKEPEPGTNILKPTVRYTPGRYGAQGSCGRATGSLGVDLRGLGEKTLFHELVHAFRTVSKSVHQRYRFFRTHGGLYGYSNSEELIAIVATNIFASERGYALRFDHRTADPPPRELNGSFEFFATSAQAFLAIEKFCKENAWFTKALSGVSAAYNPLAAYYKDPKRALAYSRKTSALERDTHGYEEEVFKKLQEERNRPKPP